MSSDPTVPHRTVATELTVPQIHPLVVGHLAHHLELMAEPHATPERSPRRGVQANAIALVPPTAPPPLTPEQFKGAIAYRLSGVLTGADLLPTAAQALGELLAADAVTIVRYLPQLGVWRQLAAARQRGASVSVQPIDTLASELPQADRLQRFEVIQARLPTEPDENLPQGDGADVAGWLFLPLQVEGLWGYLSVMQVRATAWTPAEVGLVQAGVTQFQVALTQSEAYRQMQQAHVALTHVANRSAQQLRQALANESMLKRVTDKVRDSLDETQILQTIVEELATLLQLEYCGTGIYDLAAQTCTIAYDYTTAIPSAQGTAIDLSKQYADVYCQLLQCQPVQFGLPVQTPTQAFSGHTILACPIFDNRGVLGDLWLLRPVHQVFNELEVRLVQQVTNQCAIAIRQARLYQTAQTQVESLEHINQLKDTFLSTVSHELRTPISTIKMAIQMLTLALGREGLLPDPSKPSFSSNKIAHYLKILNDECNREIGLITDLLDLQQLEAGTHSLTVQAIELSAYLHRILRPFQEQIEQQGQLLEVSIPVDLPKVHSDPQSLERILVEFLTNASKYTPAGELIQLSVHALGEDDSPGPLPTAHPHLRAAAPSLIRIAVTNSGVEIPSPQLEQIFDKFYRIPSRDPHRHSGTGLGLALVKQLAPQIGGRISAASEQGQTCFAIELPTALPVRSRES